MSGADHERQIERIDRLIDALRAKRRAIRHAQRQRRRQEREAATRLAAMLRLPPRYAAPTLYAMRRAAAKLCLAEGWKFCELERYHLGTFGPIEMHDGHVARWRAFKAAKQRLLQTAKDRTDREALLDRLEKFGRVADRGLNDAERDLLLALRRQHLVGLTPYDHWVVEYKADIKAYRQSLA